MRTFTVPVMGNELEFRFQIAHDMERDPFDKTCKYEYTLNGSVHSSSFSLPFDMEESDILRKVVEETLNQMLSRTAWLAMKEAYHAEPHRRFR